MDKNYLLDLLVSVRERNIDTNTALDEICAMANKVDTGQNIQETQEQALNIPVFRECLVDALKKVCKKYHKYGEDEIYIGTIHNGEIEVRTFDAAEIIDEILNDL